MAKEFLTSATAEFLNRQSGNASPFFYIEGILTGVTSVIGESNSATNWIVDGGSIDRAKPILPGERSSIYNSDVTLKVDNSTRRFSPDVTGSIFYGNDYLDTTWNYWAGFLNVSGTALLLQRGSFLLDNLRIDSRSTMAYIRLRDKFKKALNYRIGRGVSGTSTPFLITGTQGVKTAIEVLLTAAGLTGTDLDIQTGESSLRDISFDDQPVADAVSLIAEAGDGFIYTSRKGILTFRVNTPVFGTASAAFQIKESDYIENVFFEQTKDDRLSKVTVDFQSGTSLAVVAETTGANANSIAIQNDAVQSTGDAVAIATRFLDRFSGQVTRLEIKSAWLPSLDLGDNLSVYSTGLGLLGKNFELYKIQEDPTEGTMRLFLINADRSTGKWAFFSNATGAAAAGEHSAVFAGSGASQSGGWQAGWGFFANMSGAETTAGFDTDGDNDGIIESGVTSSGAGGTGIEPGFMFY